jgi:hypothetical protein
MDTKTLQIGGTTTGGGYFKIEAEENDLPEYIQPIK